METTNKTMRIIGRLIIWLVIPIVTILWAMFYRSHYYAISVLIIFLSIVAAFIMYEGKKIKTRELVLISVMIAIAVASRVAFYMLPQFKPVCAIIIISGVCYGAENGFLIGAITGLVSNFFFGQGIWTPFQMLGFGAIGFVAGLIFYNRKKINYIVLATIGGVITFFVYGIIVDMSSIFYIAEGGGIKAILVSYMTAVPFDLINAGSTCVFLLLIGKLMIKKIYRIKIKYGL